MSETLSVHETEIPQEWWDNLGSFLRETPSEPVIYLSDDLREASEEGFRVLPVELAGIEVELEMRKGGPFEFAWFQSDREDLEVLGAAVIAQQIVQRVGVFEEEGESDSPSVLVVTPGSSKSEGMMNWAVEFANRVLGKDRVELMILPAAKADEGIGKLGDNKEDVFNIVGYRNITSVPGEGLKYLGITEEQVGTLVSGWSEDGYLFIADDIFTTGSSNRTVESIVQLTLNDLMPEGVDFVKRDGFVEITSTEEHLPEIPTLVVGREYNDGEDPHIPENVQTAFTFPLMHSS